MKITDININYEFGRRVNYLRKLQKITIEELAFRCNLNKNYLGDIERGKRNPTLEVIDKISKGLNISLEKLFSGIGIK
ncbi:MAG: helix-turn-helix transcriptional regulator [Mollicutes bacterium]|nr:helix-turn-helix transcriptional regulator [Mollicutes bacterium]MDD7264252.1 helix-turn-helix transcriptional regulator [bacterium]MDY4980075.1 helix-turn-helix transcriptional regulator [Candidatus Onthovivens sp.]